ncbi:MAG: uroporphyrinogen-III synthase [Hyphomicrobium sp.]|nr:uroporphyrinogen-III synthase [Hyphomicrobium sp.]
MLFLVTRPEPESTKLKGLIEELGHEAVAEPLMEAELMPEAIDDLEGVTALIATSRNALRALSQSPYLHDAVAIPLFAVGRGTAEEARHLGFERIAVGPGSVTGFAAAIAGTLDPADGLILHLAGDVLAGDLAGELQELGFRVLQPVVYRMKAAEALSDGTREAIGEGAVDGVVLMSPRTARIYAGLINRHGLTDAAAEMVHVCLSDAVARSLSVLGDVPIEVAEAPSLNAILEVIQQVGDRLDDKHLPL